MRVKRSGVGLAVVFFFTGALAAGDTDALLQSIRAVGPAGQGSEAAAEAWRAVAAMDAEKLPELLAAMDGASPVARNWLRSAASALVEAARGQKKQLPALALEAFLLDTHHDAQARQLAYELLVEGDTEAPARYLPRLLDDKNLDLRREAVARALLDADRLVAGGKKAEAIALYEKSFAASRDKDQVDLAAKHLKELGKTVDLAGHYGFLLNWKVIGPFANVKDEGVHKAYPPEQRIDLAGHYPGKSGEVVWKNATAKSDTGLLNLNTSLADVNEAIAYAYAEFPADRARDVEIRLGCFTTFKMWVNGEMVLDRYDAYTGMRMDSYIAKVHLKPGVNTILLKLCREMPPEARLKLWQFIARVCDEAGTAILK